MCMHTTCAPKRCVTCSGHVSTLTRPNGKGTRGAHASVLYCARLLRGGTSHWGPTFQLHSCPRLQPPTGVSFKGAVHATFDWGFIKNTWSLVPAPSLLENLGASRCGENSSDIRLLGCFKRNLRYCPVGQGDPIGTIEDRATNAAVPLRLFHSFAALVTERAQCPR